MYAAVIKFDSLADAVRTTAQHHDFAFLGRLRLAFFLVCRIHVGGAGGEFGGAGIHPFVYRAHAKSPASCAQHRLVAIEQFSQPGIGKAAAFQDSQFICAQCIQLFPFECLLLPHQVFDLGEEPEINARQLMHFVHAHTATERVRDIPDALRPDIAQLVFNHVAVGGFFIESIASGFQSAQRFLQRFLEGAANRHHLAHRFHLRGQAVVNLGKFFKGKARHFGDHIINGRLERRRRRAAGNLVFQFIKGIAHRELRRHFGDGKAGGFRCQGGRARHPRVHFDNQHAPVLRVDGELHVGAAGIHPDFAQHPDRGVAHDLEFLVGERLRRRHGNRIAGVHAHRIEVLDGANDDAIVFPIAHHFHLELFPADHRLLDQQLFGG